MILDSGERREFNSGAVRDVQEGKGRCDLLPLDVIEDTICNLIYKFRETGDAQFINNAITIFTSTVGWQPSEALLEVAKHYEEGAKKYDERNWEKGIPLHCYVDSGVRHYLKWLGGVSDERHDRAFLWNMYGLLWTYKHLPELDDYTIKRVVEE